MFLLVMNIDNNKKKYKYPVIGFISEQKQKELSKKKDMSGNTMYTLPFPTNKRKRE